MTAAETGLLSRVPAEPLGGPGWLVERRRDAAARLRETGFPTKRVEGWRFTSVKSLVGVPFEGARGDGDAEAIAWARRHLGGSEGADDRRVYLVNGRLAGGYAGCQKLSVTSLRAALEAGADLEAHLGGVARAEHFGALNAALFEDGVVLEVEAGARPIEPVEIVHVAVPGAEPTAAYPRVLLIGRRGSEAKVVETYLVNGDGQHLTNAVTEVVLEEGAHLDHTRVQEGTAASSHVATLAVTQARDSVYVSRVVALGGALCRVDVDVKLAGPGADCTLEGVYHVRGDDHVDHQTRIEHAATDCTSRENYRGILDGRGRAVFNGIIVVARGAQRTNAHQENRNLLLSDEATINTKPHLEIDADDVKCSHGATVGAIDEDQLFYLRARGIPEDLARDMLTFAFVEALLDRITHAPVRERLSAALREML